MQNLCWIPSVTILKKKVRINLKQTWLTEKRETKKQQQKEKSINKRK